MTGYRITKYNPADRDSQGYYQKDDWISFANIGKSYENKILTLKDYLKVENSYIKAIQIFMDYLNLDFFNIINFKKIGLITSKGYSQELIKTYKNLRRNNKITRNSIPNVIRLRLRNDIGGFLETNGMIVHFGWDYYMYISSSKELPLALKQKIENIGLFVENFESPYLTS